MSQAHRSNSRFVPVAAGRVCIEPVACGQEQMVDFNCDGRLYSLECASAVASIIISVCVTMFTDLFNYICQNVCR
jgi:hypothetical protein